MLNKELAEVNINEYTFRLWTLHITTQRKLQTVTQQSLRKTITFIYYPVHVQELNEKAPANIVLALVGNKIDLEESRVVKKTEAEEYAKSLGLAYMEVSAK